MVDLEQNKMAEMCEKCLQAAKVENGFKLLALDNLRLFYYRYSDDMLEHYYLVCNNCSQIWYLDDCSYPADHGVRFGVTTAECFLSAEGREVPDSVEKTADGVYQWIASFSGCYSITLF